MGTDDEARTSPVGSARMNRPAAGLTLLVAVCLVAANMRLSITAVGPLLDQIGTDTGLSVGTLGLIAAVPLVAWAVVSPFALGLSLRFGMSRVVLASLLVLLAGTIVRSLPGPTVSLWVGTVLIGLALAIANVLMPAVIKRDFPTRVPVVMAAYTGLLGGVGAISSGVAVPLSFLGDEQSGWRIALLITGAGLLIPAIGVWAWATRGHHAVHLARPLTSRSATGIWRDALAWQVAAYMGFQAATFYMMLTWLAAISTSIGRSEVVAGFDVMIYQLTTIVGSIIVPLLLRGPAERFVPAAIPVVGMAGIAGLMLAPEGIVVWVLIAGLSSGASLSMALTLMAQRARTSDASAALSGMAQSVGYLIAAAGPVLFGWLHAGLGGWNFSLAPPHPRAHRTVGDGRVRRAAEVRARATASGAGELTRPVRRSGSRHALAAHAADSGRRHLDETRRADGCGPLGYGGPARRGTGRSGARCTSGRQSRARIELGLDGRWRGRQVHSTVEAHDARVALRIAALHSPQLRAIPGLGGDAALGAAGGLSGHEVRDEHGNVEGEVFAPVRRSGDLHPSTVRAPRGHRRRAKVAMVPSTSSGSVGRSISGSVGRSLSSSK